MKRLPIAAAALTLLAAAPPAGATEFALGGYYRMRLEMFKSLGAGVGLEGVTADRTTGFWQHRVRLDPKIKLNDNVAFFAQIDLLDNVIAGDVPEIATSFETALPEFFSQGVLPQHDVDPSGDVVGDSRRAIAVKRAWAEVLTGVGQLKFGRMGSHWGLGILANDGNGWDDDYGDTVDRIQFVTKLGPIYVVPMIDKIAEGDFFSAENDQRAYDPVDNPASLHRGSDDVDEAVLVTVYRGELTSAGVYGALRVQPATDARVWIGDAWGKTRIGPVAVEGEAVYLTGEIKNFIPPNSPPSITARQWGIAIETELPLRRWTPGLDFGAASGDDADGPTDGSIDNFTFDRNYRVAFLLFRFVHVLNAPKALTNAVYYRPTLRWKPAENLEVDAALVYAKTLRTPPEAIGTKTGAYGTELDLQATWKLYESFELGLRYALLAPGEALKPAGSGELDDFVHGVEGRFLLRF